MTSTILYLTAFIVFVTILAGSIVIVHLMYSKIYDKVREELESKYSELFDKKLAEAIEREEARLKGQHALDQTAESGVVREKQLTAEEFMAWRCMLVVRRGQEALREEEYTCTCKKDNECCK